MNQVFIYQWTVEDEGGELMIRAYGRNKHNEDVCYHVKDFKPWLSFEMRNKNFDQTSLRSKIKQYYRGSFLLDHGRYQKKLYFDHGEKVFKVYHVHFDSIEDRKRCYYSLLKIRNSMFKIHEYEASPLLQFLCQFNLPSSGWISVRKMNKIKNAYTRFSKEFRTSCTDIMACSEQEVQELGMPSFPKLSFDFETYSHDEMKHPDATHEEDVIFQIGCSFSGDNKEENLLLTLSNESFQLKNSKVITFQHEKELLEYFCNLIKERNPIVIMGYNIFGFDLPYLYNRCELHGILFQAKSAGMSKDENRIAEYKEIKWSSSAYAYQEFHYFDWEGRVVVDLLPVVKRDYKLNNYKLKTVSTFFLGETKDPMTVKDIFEAYRVGVLQKKTKKVKRCGQYCVQDARLVLLLFEKLQVWIGLLEMARICNVNVMALYTQGQQVKVFSQVYRKCFQENRLVDSFQSLDIPSNVSFHFDNYCGAYVFPPVPGKYKWVIPFDFTSLYPTTIIAYNIDYSTLVTNENVPDEECNVIKWEENGQKYHFRFRKQPMGVIPSLLQSLLQQRNITKKMLKQTKDPLLKTVFDKRQLAYKISANSMYGAMGVQKGYLPFLPGAMCTTAKGRESIQKAASFVQKEHAGKIIYGDSVHKNSLLYIKKGDSIFMQTIEQYFESRKGVVPYPQFKMEDKTICEKQQNNMENTGHLIFTHNGFAKVQRVIRHKTLKQMFSVKTTSGSIIVTEDHSLLLHDRTCIPPGCLSPLEHRLLTVENPAENITSKLLYQKENWSGLWYQKDSKIYFHSSLSEKYLSYIYFTFVKEFPNCVFLLNEAGQYYLDLLNKENVPIGLVLSITALEPTTDYVYDIETVEGSFHCGVGNLIVKNTDSIYCHFPQYENAMTVWKKAKKTEEEFLELFPPPMKLLFEEKIYRDFFILTKKRYMAYTCDENGTVDEQMTIRGVLLARRDNCSWIREFYEKIVRNIMESTRKDFEKILNIFIDEILDFFTWHPRFNDVAPFVITKALNNDYKIRELPEDLKKAQKRLDELEIKYSIPSCTNLKDINKMILEGKSKKEWIQEYINKSKPAHVQLANRMEKRGLPISIGSRMEYLVLEHSHDPNARLGDKMEDPTYFMQHCDILRLDRLHYLKSIVPSMDQLFETAFKQKDVTKKIYQYHLNHFKVLQEWKNKNGSKIVFVK